MVWGAYDPLNGSERDDVLISLVDARRLHINTGDRILLRSEVGELRGKARIAAIAPGNLAVHWPEGNAVIRTGHYDPSCGEPDYNACCELIVLMRPSNEGRPAGTR
jgi:anaerobic selenocysteine-containing dehydrogenase